MWPHQIDKTPSLDSELLSFLNRLKLSHLTQIFQNEEVLNMEALLPLNREDLKDLGIKFKDRKLIFEETSKLNKVASSSTTQYVVVDDADDSEQDFEKSEHYEKTLLLTSSGDSAEYCGIGMYKEAGTYNNCHYYKQMDTVRTDGKEEVIYRREEGGWAMGLGLGGTRDFENASKNESVPLTGWTFWYDGENLDDPHMRIYPDQPPACGEITISASGDAAGKHPECLGVYKPTQMFSRGRQVFKHKSHERYLFVPTGHSVWCVNDSFEIKRPNMQSGCACSMCPADPRARTYERLGLTSWQYLDDGWKNGDITVKCSVLKLIN